MTIPLLKTFAILFFNQLSFSIPRLLQFMGATENLRFSNVEFLFYHEAVAAWLYPPMENASYNFYIKVICEHLDWQVSSMAQILNVLRPLLSSVVDLTLDYREHTLSSQCHNEVDQTLWCKLFRSFRNVKTLRVHSGLIGNVSRSLRLNGGSPLELLPELTELVCPVGNVDDGTFSAFI
jgi:hypothetical protein